MPMLEDLLRTLALARSLREAREARLEREHPEPALLRAMPDYATILRRKGEAGLTPGAGVEGPWTPGQSAFAKYWEARGVPRARYAELAEGMPGAEDIEARQNVARMTASGLHEFLQKFQQQADMVSRTSPGTPNRANAEAEMATLVGQYTSYFENLPKALQGPGGGAEAIGGITRGPSVTPRSGEFYKAQEAAKTGPLEEEVSSIPGLEGLLEYFRGKRQRAVPAPAQQRLPAPPSLPSAPDLSSVLESPVGRPPPKVTIEGGPAALPRPRGGLTFLESKSRRPITGDISGMTLADEQEIHLTADDIGPLGGRAVSRSGKWIVIVRRGQPIEVKRAHQGGGAPSLLR